MGQFKEELHWYHNDTEIYLNFNFKVLYLEF